MMPRIRLFVAVFIAVNIIMIFSVAEDSTPFTSVVLQRKRTNYLNFAGKTYYFGTVFRANFYRAMQFCRQQGMQLVSIQSKAENDRLGRFAEEIGEAPHGHYWLSGTNLAEENQWIWLSTGNNFVYSNWHPGEPSGTGSSNTSENCVEARHWGKGFTWNDLRCNAELNFICETLESC
ncbi:hypothetical protein NQ317_016145, partial [Molorchus minor]